MLDIVTCPNCSRKLRVPDDLLGKTVRCPECKEPFVAQGEAIRKDENATNEPPTETSEQRELGVSTGPRSADGDGAPLPSLRQTDYDDEDHPLRRDYEDDFDGSGGISGSGTRSGWQRVRLGLNLFIFGIYIVVGGLVLGLLSIIIALLLGGAAIATMLRAGGSSSGATAGGGAAAVIAIVLGVAGYGLVLLGVFIQWILQGVGQVFFLWIPHRPGTGRRPLAIATLSLWGAQLVFTIFNYSLICLSTGIRNANAGAVFGLGSNCVNLLSIGCSLAWFFVFMFLLRSIALAMGENGLARSIVIYMIVVPVFAVVTVVSILVVACGGGVAMASFARSSSSSPGSAASMGIGWLIALIVVAVLIVVVELALWIWYVVILHQVRGSISRRLAY